MAGIRWWGRSEMAALGSMVITVVVSCLSFVSGSLHLHHTPPKTNISCSAGVMVQGGGSSSCPSPLATQTRRSPPPVIDSL